MGKNPLKSDRLLVNYIECIKNHHTTTRVEQKRIQVDLSREICGMLATLARSDGERALVEELRLALSGEDSGISAQVGLDRQLEAEEDTQLAVAIRRALREYKSEREPASTEEWLASVMSEQTSHKAHGFPWVNSESTVSLSTNIIENDDSYMIDTLSEDQTIALSKALLKSDRKTRLAVYPKLKWVTLFPGRTSINTAFLNEIREAESDDLRWFIFSGWLSEGWSGDIRVLELLPELRVYLDDLPSPEKTDFLIYRRVLNLMAANERGDLEEKIEIAPDN